jgi:hypothetical protein
MVKTFSMPVEPPGYQASTGLFLSSSSPRQFPAFSPQSSVPGSRFPVPGSWFPLLGSRLPVLGSRLPVLNNKVLSLAGIKGALKSTLMDRILKAVVVISIFQIADNALQ